MKDKKEVLDWKLKNVYVTVNSIDNGLIKISGHKIRYVIEDLKKTTVRVRIIIINLAYTNGEHKRAECDSLSKAISWLNLNDTKE